MFAIDSLSYESSMRAPYLAGVYVCLLSPLEFSEDFVKNQKQ